MIEQLLEHIREDKNENPSTTSKKFKQDLFEYFTKEEVFKEMNCCEFGTHKGQTTYILSHIFNEVYTINLSEQHFVEARKTCYNRSNIFYIPMNLYGEKIEYNPIYAEVDVFLIDAGHSYDQVRKDIERVQFMKPKNRPAWVIFDDYGLIPDVRQAIEDVCETGDMTIVEFIGHDPGYDFDNGRVLKDYEGVICVMP